MIGSRRLIVGLPGCIGLLAPTTAGAATFTVTTTTDEYGENPGARGLREAVEAANTDSNFGGCMASDAFPNDQINLPAPTYVLTPTGWTTRTPTATWTS